MTELTDLQICKRIAEIEGVEYLCDRGVVILNENYSELINTICSGRYSPEQVVKIIDEASYNPLTDDALCFQLMVKYQVDTVHERFIKQALIYDDPEDNPIGRAADKSMNKAILLAITESKRES